MKRFVVFGAVLLSACGQDHEFVGPDFVHTFAMTEQTAPFYQDEQVSVYIVEQRIPFTVVAPTNDRLDELTARAQGLMLPFPRLPWVARGDWEIEVDYTISNLTDQNVSATVTLNGISEFFEYTPGVRIEDDEAIIDFSQWERLLDLSPFERRTGTIREEDMDEVAVDLATVVNGAPNSNLVVYFENQSDRDPRVQQYIPSAIPGLVGVRMGIRTNQAVNVVLETTIRIRDVEDRFEDDASRAWELPTPTLFVPVAPAEG